MKKFLFLLLICFAFQFNYSQETYSLGGEIRQLNVEIDGQLDLLWTTIDNNYHFFVRTEDGNIAELENTLDATGSYKEEYKSTLSRLTNGQSTEKLKFMLSSLRKYIHEFNASVDPSYIETSSSGSAQLRLGVSGGITNNPFVRNPGDIKSPLIGLELEIFEASETPRHAGFFQARHAFENSDLNYTATELSIGYRYRIINKSSFSIYAQVKLATLNFTDFTIIDENDTEINLDATTFDAPFIFGIGADFKVGKNSYITLIYGELFAILIDNQGNFPTDISLGYKFNL